MYQTIAQVNIDFLIKSSFRCPKFLVPVLQEDCLGLSQLILYALHSGSSVIVQSFSHSFYDIISTDKLEEEAAAAEIIHLGVGVAIALLSDVQTC